MYPKLSSLVSLGKNGQIIKSPTRRIQTCELPNNTTFGAGHRPSFWLNRTKRTLRPKLNRTEFFFRNNADSFFRSRWSEILVQQCFGEIARFLLISYFIPFPSNFFGGQFLYLSTLILNWRIGGIQLFPAPSHNFLSLSPSFLFLSLSLSLSLSL